MLYFPIPFFLAIIWEVLFRVRYLPVEKNFATVVAKLFFLNNVHVYLSLSLLIFSPSLRTWFSEKRKSEKLFATRWIIVFGGCFALFAWGLPFLKTQAIDPRLYAIVIAISTVVGIHHNYSQTLGISLAYHRKFDRDSAGDLERARVEKLEKAERLLWRISMALHGLLIFIFAVIPKDRNIALILNAGMFVCAVGLILLALKLPRALASKQIFMFRYLLYPFVPFSFAAFIAILSVHGIEYLGLFQRMHRESVEIHRLNRRVMAAGIFVLVATLTTLTIFGRSTRGLWFTALLEDQPTLVLYLGSLALAASFLHYHIDAQMFRMRDEATRSIVAPLLFGRSRASDP